MGGIVKSASKLVGGVLNSVIGGVVPQIPEAPPPQAPVSSAVAANTTAGNLDPKNAPVPSGEQIKRAERRASTRAASTSGRRSTILSTGSSDSGKKTTLGG